jgi:hypothetical protein
VVIPSENDANSTPAPNAREPDRLAGGTISGRGHALNAHPTPFSAGNRGIHQRGVETSSREQCVAGAEAPAVPVSCRDWERKHRPAARAQAPRTDDEEPLLRCTCVKAPSDRTDNPQPPHELTGAHGATSATASPPLTAAVQVGAGCPNLLHLPKHLGGRCCDTTQPVARRLSTVSTLAPCSSSACPVVELEVTG